MGHLVNPISARLGIVRVWNSTWVSNKGVSYSYLLTKDLELQKSLELFFYKTNSCDYWAIIFDKVLIFRTSKRVSVFIVLYSWKFFDLVDRLFKGVTENVQSLNLDGKFLQERGFFEKKTSFEHLLNRKHNIVRKSNMSFDGMNFGIFYARILVHSFDKFRLLMCNIIHKELLNIVFLRCFEDYVFVRNRYIFCLKAVKDYLFLRFLYIKLNNIFLKNKNLTLHSTVFFKFFYFFNTFFYKINIYYSIIMKKLTLFFHKQLQERLFYFVKNKFFFKHNFNYRFNKNSGFFFKKKVCKFSFFCLNFVLFSSFIKINKKHINSLYFNYIKYLKHRVKTIFRLPLFLVGRSFSLFVIYLKRLIDCYNYRISLLSSLLKHNYSWWLFVFVKIILRKQLAVYYGKRLWYIRSFIEFFFKKKAPNFAVYFLFPSFLVLTAKMIAYVIRIRLTQKYSLGEILNKFVNYLDGQSELIGYRITCHGRFTRRQRASHKMVKSSLKYRDRLLLNTFTGLVDYAYVEEPLKYGMCGIRIWLIKNPNFHNINFTFSIKQILADAKYKQIFYFLKKYRRILVYLELNRRYVFTSKAKGSFFLVSQFIKLGRFVRRFHFKYFALYNKLIGVPFNFKRKYYSVFFMEELKKKFFLLY